MLPILMHAKLAAALFALLAGLAHAQADPLKSPACGRALEALQAEHAASANGPRDAADRVERARREAGMACLGASPGSGRPAPVAQAPVRVPPPTITPPAAAQLPRPAPPPGPVALPRASAPATACDAGGCWDASGQRLNRSGAQLIGPRGACTEQAGVLLCP